MSLSNNLFVIHNDSPEETAERYDIRIFEESLTVEEIVLKTPLSDFTSAIPWPVSDNFEITYPNATFKNYWDDYVNNTGPELLPLKETESLIISPKKTEWIDIRKPRINEYGGQRLQIRDPKEARLLRDHAEQFDFRLVTVKIALCDNNKEEFGGLANEMFVYDGGGCCTKALLRGISHLPAQVVKVSTQAELRQLFWTENTAFNQLKGIELFKKKLVERDPFARLQDRIMERSGVTPVKYHTNDNLIEVGLSPIKALLETKFKDVDDTSWSGDPTYQIDNPAEYWDKRKAPTVEFALDSLTTVYPGEKLSAYFMIIAAGQFKAIWNGSVPQKQFIDMLYDYKTGKTKITLDKIDASLPKVPADFSNLRSAQSSLNLVRMASEKHWGVVALSHLWNHWAGRRTTIKKLDPKHIGIIQTKGNFKPYQH